MLACSRREKFSDGIDDDRVYTAREWLEKRYVQLAPSKDPS
jgi:hypothetical protein